MRRKIFLAVLLSAGLSPVAITSFVHAQSGGVSGIKAAVVRDAQGRILKVGDVVAQLQPLPGGRCIGSSRVWVADAGNVSADVDVRIDGQCRAVLAAIHPHPADAPLTEPLGQGQDVAPVRRGK
jgi:hypothetical protein